MSRCDSAPSKYSHDSGYHSTALMQSGTNCIGTYIGDEYASGISDLSYPARPDFGLYPASSLASLCSDYEHPSQHVQKKDGAAMKDSSFEAGDELQWYAPNSNLLPFSSSGRSSFHPVKAT
jgi:hypothetical protein